MKPSVIYSDDDIIAIDKPAGIPSVSLEGGSRETCASWLIENFPELKNVGPGEREAPYRTVQGEAGLIQRLDNDTSGVMIAAKTNESYEILKSMMSDGKIAKHYIALVVGHVAGSGNIDLPIAHHPRKKRKMIVCEGASKAADLDARDAETSYAPTAHYRLENTHYTLLAVTIKTGARHQIRAHLASLGRPIAGDRLYQSPRMRDEDALRLDRHFLHACRVVFRHPRDGRPMDIESPLPDELRAALGELT